MKEHNNIDDLFKDAFDGFSVLPDDSIKSAIDKRLFEKKSKRRFGFWLFFASAAFGLTTGIYYFSTPTQTFKNGTNTVIQSAANNTIGDKNKAIAISKLETGASANIEEIEVKQDLKTEVIQPLFSEDQPQKRGNGSKVRSSSTSKNIDYTRRNALPSEFSKNQFLIGALKTKKIDSLYDERTYELDLALRSNDSSFISTIGPVPVRTFRQSITAFVNYGYESTTSRNTAQNYNDFERGTIKISGIEARIEYKRSISNSFAFNAGVGYGNYSLRQKGNLTTWDLADASGWITSDTLPPIYTPSYYSDELKYRFQQIQLGIGISYTHAIFQNWNLDLSLGGNFNVGQVRKLSGSSLFETPTVSKVGVSVYLRPAIEYRFGRYAILAFGRIDQPVVSQIKWSFLSNRNPNFGGGIACRYYF